LHDPAEGAVDRFRRVEVERRGAGGGEGGRDLLADEPALAHARDDHAAAAGEEDVDRAVEGRVQARDEALDRLGLELQDLARGLAGHACILAGGRSRPEIGRARIRRARTRTGPSCSGTAPAPASTRSASAPRTRTTRAATEQETHAGSWYGPPGAGAHRSLAGPSEEADRPRSRADDPELPERRPRAERSLGGLGVRAGKRHVRG